MKHLISFKIHKGTFSCYGDMKVLQRQQGENVNLPILELIDVSATRLNDGGVAEEYEPTETTWSGCHYTEDDMVTSVLHTLLLHDTECEVLYIHPELQEIIDLYSNNTVAIGEVLFPRYLLKDGDKIFILSLVTDKWVYYSHDDELAMYQYETNSSSERYSLCLIADGYFAEQGCYDSALGIKRGDEKLLYSDGWDEYIANAEE